MQVLAVDDNPVALKLLEQMLRRGGYEVVTADNGTAPRSIFCSRVTASVSSATGICRR